MGYFQLSTIVNVIVIDGDAIFILYCDVDSSGQQGERQQ